MNEDERWCTVPLAAKALGVSPSTVRRRIAAGTLTARKEPAGRRFRWLVSIPVSPDERPDLVEVGLASPGNDGASERRGKAESVPTGNGGDSSDAPTDAPTDTPRLRSIRDHSISALVASTVLVAALVVWILPLERADSFAVVTALVAALTAVSEASGAFAQWRRGGEDRAGDEGAR